MTNIFTTSADTIAGANQLALLLASGIVAAISVYNKVSWDEIMRNIVHTVSTSLPAILVLLMVGILSGA